MPPDNLVDLLFNINERLVHHRKDKATDIVDASREGSIRLIGSLHRLEFYQA